MGGKYKYYAQLLEEYTKTATQPVLLNNSALLSFHFSRTETEYFKSNFSINPFSETDTEINEFDIKSLIPLSIENTELVTSKFRSLEYDTKGNSINPLRHGKLPFLFIPHDSWWEYENFSKFPDYETWYSMKFYEWHKHMVTKDYKMVTFDPLWSIDPKEKYYNYYMYYYTTTLKYYRPWKIGLPIEVFYDSSRILVYFLFFSGIYMYYAINHLRSRTRYFYIIMGEDWWIKEWESIKLGTNKSSPVSGLTDVPFVEIIQYFFTEIFFSFRYGPGKLASIQEEFEKTRELTKEDFYQIIKK